MQRILTSQASNISEIADNDFVKTVCAKLKVPTEDANRREKGLEALKIFKTIGTKQISGKALTEVYLTGLHGFYTFCNMSDVPTEDEVEALGTAIIGGYYKCVKVRGTAEAVSKIIPKELRQTILWCETNRILTVEGSIDAVAEN